MIPPRESSRTTALRTSIGCSERSSHLSHWSTTSLRRFRRPPLRTTRRYTPLCPPSCQDPPVATSETATSTFGSTAGAVGRAVDGGGFGPGRPQAIGPTSTDTSSAARRRRDDLL